MDCRDSALLVDAVIGFYTKWLDGSLSPHAAALFAVGRAVLIPKQGGGVRPLGIGDPWYRLGAQLVASRVVSTVSSRLAPLQLGAGTASGCEIAARTMQIALDRDHGDELDVCIFTLDIRNAFNSMRRNHILSGIREHCPSLEPFFRLFYGSATELRLSNGAPAAISGTGVRQGDPLAMALFALGFQSALVALQAAHRRALDETVANSGHGEGHIIAYADDVGGSLPASAMPRFCQEAINTLAEFDLHVVPVKCGIHGRLAATIPSPPFPVLPEGLRKFLGCPIGDIAFRAQITSAMLTNMTTCVPYLVKMGSYTAFSLLAGCINQRAQYLARIIEIPDISVRLAYFDNAIDAALITITDCSAQDRMQLGRVRSLPRRLGGLGVLSHSGPEGDCSRNASRNATLHYIRTSGLPRTFYNQLQGSWAQSMLGWGGTETTRTMTDKDARQQMLAAQMERFNQLYTDQAEDPQRRAWAALLLSNASRGSGRWLQYTGGATKRFRMGDDLFKDALRLRCMLLPSEAAQIAASRCQCKQAAQQHVTHLLDCKCNQWYYIHRHNTACDLLAAFIRKIRPDVIIHREQLLRAPDEEEETEDEVSEDGGNEGGSEGGSERGSEGGSEGGGEGEDQGEDEGREEGRDEGGGVGGEEGGDQAVGLIREEGDTSEESGGEEGAESGAAREGLSTAPGGTEGAMPAAVTPARRTADVVGDRRSDLVCIFPHATYTIDMSFVNPGCRKYIRRSRSHEVEGAAAAERENEKRAKYADVPGMEEGGAGGFVPFAVEVTGRIGCAGWKFIRAIATIEDTFCLSNFLSALSAMSAMHLSMMVKNKMRKFSELERVKF